MMNDPRLYSWPDLPLAVVIGAGGMGMAVARRLGQHYRLLLVDVNAAQLETRAAALRDEGHHVEPVVCDITSADSVASVAQTVAERGGFRVLAHVAGLSPSMADGRTIMAVNLVGAALMEQALLPLAGAGTAAIFISSLAAHTLVPDARVQPVLDNPLAPDFLDELEAALVASLETGLTPTLAYQLSKNTLNRLCQRRAWAWGEKRARILTISPGLISTPMGNLEFKNQPMKYDLLAKTPLQRQGNMHEIADALEFLASDRASFISGIDLLVDGGICAAMRHGIQSAT